MRDYSFGWRFLVVVFLVVAIVVHDKTTTTTTTKTTTWTTSTNQPGWMMMVDAFVPCPYRSSKNQQRSILLTLTHPQRYSWTTTTTTTNPIQPFNHHYKNNVFRLPAFYSSDGSPFVPQDEQAFSTEAKASVSQPNQKQQVNRNVPSGEQASQRCPHLIFPGGGLYFYWQAGVVTYLREQGYQLGGGGGGGGGGRNGVTLAGASAGALTATLTATNVDMYHAMELALELSKQVGVWDRPQGLQGVWGQTIRLWLDELLPVEHAVEWAHDCQLNVVVTQIPWLNKERLFQFHNRSDLIECNMASVHIPWFLDNQWTAHLRGKPYIDGSFWIRNDPKYLMPLDWNPPTPNESLAASTTSGSALEDGSSLWLPSRQDEEKDSSNILVLDYSKDPALQNKSLLDALKVVSPDSIRNLLEQGKRHAKVMEEQGQFAMLSRQSE